MTRYGVPPGSVATSRTRTTCSLRILIAARPSRRNRATSAGSCASSGIRNLMATRSSSWMCGAASTMPMPPRPSSRSMRYLSARTSLAAGMRSAFAMIRGRKTPPRAYENITLRLEPAIVESPRIIAYARVVPQSLAAHTVVAASRPSRLFHARVPSASRALRAASRHVRAKRARPSFSPGRAAIAGLGGSVGEGLTQEDKEDAPVFGREMQRANLGVLIGDIEAEALAPAPIVEVDDLLQRRVGPVVEVGPCATHVANRGHAEVASTAARVAVDHMGVRGCRHTEDREDG